MALLKFGNCDPISGRSVVCDEHYAQATVVHSTSEHALIFVIGRQLGHMTEYWAECGWNPTLRRNADGNMLPAALVTLGPPCCRMNDDIWEALLWEARILTDHGL